MTDKASNIRPDQVGGDTMQKSYLEQQNADANIVAFKAPLNVNDTVVIQEEEIECGFRGDNGSWPWIASIGHYGLNGTWNHHCTGSLISSRLVMTAAHCIKKSKQDYSLL